MGLNQDTPSFPNYSGLYGGLAFLAPAMTGGPIYAEPESRYYTLWEMLTTPYGATLGFLALLMVGVVCALCVRAAIRPVTSVGLPIAVGLIGVLAVAMLLTRLGAPSEAVYDTAGGMLLITAFGLIALAAAHTAHLLWWRSVARRIAAAGQAAAASHGAAVL